MNSPRLLLCLVLFASSLSLAQAPDNAPPPSSPPPLVPAAEQPQEAPPAGEIIPRDYRAPRPPSPPFALGRVTLGLVGGTLGGAMLGGVGSLLLIGSAGGCSEDCLSGAVILAAPLAALGVSIGVYAAGRAMRGNGGFLASLGGTAVGLGAGALISEATDGALTAPLLILPVVGAVIGYEMSHSPEPLPPEWSGVSGGESASAGLQLVPLFGATPRGGLFGGLLARF
ncbi:MAG: hypothetical protein JXB05_29455 [Myxococcaceae bacterium]|nr:hypothetical protein [Myxococcaceae bacterium]